MLDPNSLVAPLITALLTALGVYVGMSNQVAVIKVEITNLRRQVEKHNSVVERTYQLETNTRTSFQRIDELRGDISALRSEVQRLDRELASLTKIGGTD